MDYILEPALDVPGLEGVWEYNGLRMNDFAALERIRFTGIGGLQDDADVRESREPNSDRPGEHAGIQQDGGRTITAEGVIEAGSIPSVRRLWRKTKGAFDGTERDLTIRVPKEVANYTNSVTNPAPEPGLMNGWQGEVTGTGGSAFGITSVTDGLRQLGNVAFTSAGTGVLTGRVWTQNGIDWNGEDIWVSARLKMNSAPATATSVVVAIYYYSRTGDPNTTGSEISSTTLFTQSAPVTGTIYEMSSRVLGSAVPVGTVKISIRLIVVAPATAGSWAMRFFDINAVLLGATAASPAGAFDGGLPGFEWAGVPGWSKSFGPVNQYNGIPDVTTADIRELTGSPTLWANGSAAGATVNAGPTPIRNAGIVGAATAMYMKVTNPDATARTIAIRPDTTTAGVPMRVQPGRTYRATYTVKIIQSATKVANIDIVWMDLAGATLSTATAAGSAATAEQRITVVATAPARAVKGYARVSFAATAAAQVFEWSVSDPAMIDISDYDPGSLANFTNLAGDDPYTQRVKNVNGYPAGSIRRIPRPFVVKRLRKASPATGPEKQSDMRHRRDFMLTLRASDPRIYFVDQESSWISMLGSNLTYESAQPTVPKPDTAVPLGLSSGSFFNIINSDPSDLHFYQGPDGSLRLRTTDTINSGGRSDLGVQTSTVPWVRIRGNPAAISSNPPGQTVLTLVLKWLSAGNFISITWISQYNLFNTFSLAKVVGGVATTLASVTYAARVSLPNTWFMAWMDNANLITAGVYTKYPDTSIDMVLPTPAFGVSYTLAAGAETTTFGSAVAGRMGFGMTTSPPDPVNYPLSQHPGVMQYEAADGLAQSRGTMTNIPLMGDYDDVPLSLGFNGLLSWPTVILTTPDGNTSSMSFQGVLGSSTDKASVLNFDSNFFRDASGNDLWDSILPFYGRLALQPGNNRLRVVARDWSNGPHVGVSYRAAMK